MTQDIEVTVYSDPWTPREFILLNRYYEAGYSESWITLVKLLTRRTSLSQEQVLDMPVHDIRRVWKAMIDQLNSSPDISEPLVTPEQAIAEVEQIFRENKKGGITTTHGSNDGNGNSTSSGNGDSSTTSDTTTGTGEGQDSARGGLNKLTSDD